METKWKKVLALKKMTVYFIRFYCEFINKMVSGHTDREDSLM
jgi:hypothetical protein